jgi:hypothetical protein
MFVHTKINVRPSVDVDWYKLPEDVEEHRYNNYEVTKKMLYRSEALSEDGLTRTITTVFSDRNTYEEYIKDPIIANMFILREEYNLNNNIVGLIP